MSAIKRVGRRSLRRLTRRHTDELEDSSSEEETSLFVAQSGRSYSRKSPSLSPRSTMSSSSEAVTCPVCARLLTGMENLAINSHIDDCLTHQLVIEERTGVVSPPPPSEAQVAGSPFCVACPYAGCGVRLEARDFPSHLNAAHNAETNHRYACPICELMGEDSYEVKDGTNLYSHVQTQHSDFVPRGLGHSAPDAIAQDSLSAAVGGGMIEQVLSQSLEGECSICYEEFEMGDKITRMDCFCTFHSICVEQWFAKCRKRECPLHSLDEGN